jgi:hypothetical protein
VISFVTFTRNSFFYCRLTVGNFTMLAACQPGKCPLG